jgi:hypothetical protein
MEFYVKTNVKIENNEQINAFIIRLYNELDCKNRIIDL